MEASILLSQVVVALSLFSSLAAALPPAIQPHTTPKAPAHFPATRITITSLAPTSTDTSSTATLTQTAPEISVASHNFQVSNAISVATPIPNAVLELRFGPATPATATTTLDASNTITQLTLPSGFTNTQEFQEKWYQTTYWSCVTDAVQTHCGWHEPVLPGGDNSIGGAVLERRARPFVIVGLTVMGALLVGVGWGGWGF